MTDYNIDNKWKSTGNYKSLEYPERDERPFNETVNPHPLEFACGFTEDGIYMISRYEELFEGDLDSLCELAETSLLEVIKELIRKIKEKKNEKN